MNASTSLDAKPAWMQRCLALVGQEWPAVQACDPVNAPMIRHWREALGFSAEWGEPETAPATMLQPWLFPGPTRARPPGSAETDATDVLKILAEAGYTGVVTASTEMEFPRALRVGNRLSYTSRLESVGDEKVTALGIGHFLNFCFTVRDDSAAVVGLIRFANLVYRPTST